jgi:hypothetical protein
MNIPVPAISTSNYISSLRLSVNSEDRPGSDLAAPVTNLARSMDIVVLLSVLVVILFCGHHHHFPVVVSCWRGSFRVPRHLQGWRGFKPWPRQWLRITPAAVMVCTVTHATRIRSSTSAPFSQLQTLCTGSSVDSASMVAFLFFSARVFEAGGCSLC